MIVGGIAILFAVILGYLVVGSNRAAADEMQVIAGQGTDVSLPVSLFADGKARFFHYATASGRQVRFFVMKSADGVIRAAFDACDTCYRERKGYYQAGDLMVCRNCSQTFRSVDINVLQGGCNPAPLDRSVVGDQVVVRASSLDAGTGYF